MALYVINLYNDVTVQIKAGSVVRAGDTRVVADGSEIDFLEPVQSIERFEQ